MNLGIDTTGATMSPLDRFGSIQACPGCGHHEFLIGEDGEAVVFVCQGCRKGWRSELGYVWPVDRSCTSSDWVVGDRSAVDVGATGGPASRLSITEDQ